MLHKLIALVIASTVVAVSAQKSGESSTFRTESAARQL